MKLYSAEIGLHVTEKADGRSLSPTVCLATTRSRSIRVGELVVGELVVGERIL